MPDESVRLSSVIELRRTLIDPRRFPRETFASYSMPAFDRDRQPEIVSGDQIDSAKFVLTDNTILISKLNPRIKRVWHIRMPSGVRALSSTEFINVVPLNERNTEFLYHLLSSDLVYRQLERMAEGTTNSHVRFKPSALERLQICPIAGEKSWSTIGRVATSLDQAIEQTEALLAKMQRVKAGTMHDLFTRGVTTDGRLRPPQDRAPREYKQLPSGYVPADWESIALGSMSQIVSGVTLDAKRQLSGMVEVPYLRVANVQDGFLDLSEVKTVAVSPAEAEQLLLRAGDVLMNEGGDFDKLGRGCVWEAQIDPCIHQNHVFRVRCDARQLVPQYLAYWSQSTFGKQYFVRSSKQSTNLASINSKQLKAFPIMVPSLAEQDRIVTRVAAIDAQLNSLRLQQRKFRLLRSGLMHNLFTGRVQVSSPDAAS